MPKRINVLGTWVGIKILRAPRFKKGWTIWPEPPWSRIRGYLAERDKRPNLKRVNDAFAAVAKLTEKMALSDRMKIISAAMKGKSFGGKKRVVYPPASPETIRAKIREAREIVAKYVAPTYAPPPE